MAHSRPPGVRYATTPDGLELPVVDVTHPAFALPVDRAGALAAIEGYVRAEARRGALQQWLRRATMRVFLRRSVLGRAIQGAAGTYLAGLPTYLMKLGPDNLGDYATDIDRRIAASAPVLAVRLRLLDMARLLQEGLAPALAARTAAPLHLVNIGGGPAADSLNALILLRKEHPGSLEGREIRIHVLDRDDRGPAFGASALAALRSDVGALHGLDVALEHVRYDWADTAVLERVLAGIGRPDAVMACSAEGSLFDYGSAEEIVKNLRRLAAGTPLDTVVVGSVTRGGRAARVRRASGIKVRPRTLDEFTTLLDAAGWTIARVLDTAISYHARLAKQPWMH